MRARRRRPTWQAPPKNRRGAALRATAVIALSATLPACGADGAGPRGTSADLAFVAGTGAVTRTTPSERSAPVDLRGPLLGGGRFDLATHRGKVVLINIWGSWCAPCRKEAPALREAWAQLRGGDVLFLGINTRDDAAGAAEAFERRFGITYPSLRDPDGRLQLTFRDALPPRAIPSTLVLDRRGRVAARVIGPTTKETFVGLVQDVLSKSPSSTPSSPR